MSRMAILMPRFSCVRNRIRWEPTSVSGGKTKDVCLASSSRLSFAKCSSHHEGFVGQIYTLKKTHLKNTRSENTHFISDDQNCGPVRKQFNATNKQMPQTNKTNQ